jgi:uncharacterized membrane protein
MTPKHALQTALAVSLFGMIFSGGLTYREFFADAAKCPAPGAPGTVFGYPACVYGFFMYTALVIVCALGVRAVNRTAGP